MTTDWQSGIDGAMEALGAARKLIAEQFPGINEAEAIAYARGFAHGMAAAGHKGEPAELTMACCALTDKMLSAGTRYMGLAITERIVHEECGGKKQ